MQHVRELALYPSHFKKKSLVSTVCACAIYEHIYCITLHHTLRNDNSSRAWYSYDVLRNCIVFVEGSFRLVEVCN